MPRNEDGEHDLLYNALITPFEEGSFEVDYDAYDDFIRYHLDNDRFVQHGGLIANPEAGEVFYLDDDEYENIIARTVELVDGEVPIFAGVFGLRRAKVLERAALVEELGADGIFLMPPMGSLEVTTAGGARAYPESWVDHVGSVADQSDLPIIVHPTAPLSSGFGAGLPLQPTVDVLENVPEVVGWKMTYNLGGYNRIARSIRDLDHHVGVLCASGSYYQEKLAAGYFDGSVSGSFNYALEPMLEHYLAWKEGDTEEATRIWRDGLAELQQFIYAENKTKLHIRYKVAAWLRGFTSHPYMRPPMPAPSREDVERIDALLRNVGLETIDESEREQVLETPVRKLARATDPVEGTPTQD